MERNKLYIALIVLAALGGLTYLAYHRSADAESGDTVSDPWRHVDKTQTTRLLIQRPGDAPAIELEKRDNHWFMNRPAQGPADDQAVNDALTSFADMHVSSIASHEASSHADMEVDPAHAIHLQLFRGSTPQLDVLIGKNLDGGSAVSAGSGPQVYRVDRSIRYVLNKEPREWRDRVVTHIDRAHVRSIEWHTATATWHFDRNGDTWTPAATNPAVDRLDTARVNQTIINLISLRAMDFAAANATTGITADSPQVTISTDDDGGGPVVLKVGADVNTSEVYLQRAGNDTIFTVGRTHAGEINVTNTTFQAPAPVADAGAAAHDAAVGGPPAMMPDGGIPPAVMEQIRRQMMQRQMMGGHP